MVRPGKRKKSSASSSDGAPTPRQTKGSREVLADPTNMAAEEGENLEEEAGNCEPIHSKRMEGTDRN